MALSAAPAAAHESARRPGATSGAAPRPGVTATGRAHPNDLGRTLAALGRHSEARALHEQALERAADVSVASPR